MNASDANNPAVTDRRFTVAVDENRHKRVKLEAVRQGMKTRQLVELLIDHTMPLIENGTLKIQQAGDS